MERFNEAATFAAKAGFEAGVFSQPSIHKRVYREIRARFGLSAQMAVRAIGKAVESFQRDKTVCPVFKPFGAVTYDERILSFQGLDQVSLWTMTGRQAIALVYGTYQGQRFDRIKGQCDLIYRDGTWLLLATVEFPEKPPVQVTRFLGVDLGIANIATDSDGTQYSGKPVDRVRRKHNLQRTRLGHRNTKGAKKKLKRIAGKEARFRRHENHGISKALIAIAKDTGRGIACEDLRGIRDRLPVWAKDARHKRSGWSFFPLFSFLSYKAQRAGIPSVTVDPPEHVPDMCPLRPLREGQSDQPSDISLRVVRAPRPRGSKRRRAPLGSGRLYSGLGTGGLRPSRKAVAHRRRTFTVGLPEGFVGCS